jgi:hypothetical protein
LIIKPSRLAQRYVRTFLLRMASDNRGSVAVEYAMLMLPFLTILFAMLETGYMLFISILMEGATSDAARQVRTGNIQQAEEPLVLFKRTLCDNMFNVVKCDDLNINVKAFGNTLKSSGNFAPGSAGELIVVRVSFKFSFVTPFLADILEASPNGGDGTVLLVSNSAFRNEPFKN